MCARDVCGARCGLGVWKALLASRGGGRESAWGSRRKATRCCPPLVLRGATRDVNKPCEANTATYGQERLRSCLRPPRHSSFQSLLLSEGLPTISLCPVPHPLRTHPRRSEKVLSVPHRSRLRKAVPTIQGCHLYWHLGVLGAEKPSFSDHEVAGNNGLEFLLA